ncbi:hypothetical protein [Nocardia sp. NPDC051463]|uniref:hypothetical protein n=1 Tax=Nocardia sp. NPDC051463 TaxID=3154845 RepID=UPI003412A173
MTSYDDYRNRIIAAQEQWNRDREAIYTSTNSLTSNFTGEFDPPKIPGPDNYDSMTLAQMIEAADAMKPSAARQAGEAWLNIGAQLAAATTLFNQHFARTVNGDGGHGGWTGQSGAAAAAAVNNYAKKSENLPEAAALVSYKLLELQTGLEQTQALMPQATQRPDLHGKTLPQEGVMKSGDYTEEEATQEARRVLRTVFGQVVNQTDHGVPVLPAAPPIVDDPSPPPVAPPGGTSAGPAGSGESGKPSEVPESAGDPGSTEPSGSPEQPIATDPAATTPQSVTPANATQQPASPANTPATPANTPSGTGIPSPTAPSPTTPTIPPRSTGTPNTPGRPSSPGIPSTPGTPAPGRSIPGVPQQPSANPLAASSGTGNRPGTAGASGVAPGAAGKGKDDERETSGTKDYLINTQNGEEVTGLDSLPKTVPPVIGGGHD